MKKNNRRAEIMLHDLEYLATMATIKDRRYLYPKADLDKMWKNVLLCQFHDCLPGSTIEMCVDDARDLYGNVFEIGQKCINDAMSVLNPAIHEGHPILTAVNTLPWSRKEIVKLSHQIDPGESYALIDTEVGPANVQVLSTAAIGGCPPTSISKIKEGVFQMENYHYRLQVEDGSITSLMDLVADREVIAKGGRANQLVIFDDKPLYWQAWDVEVYHLETRKELHATSSYIVEDGPFKVSLTTKTNIGGSSWVKTTISLTADSADVASYVQMDSEIEWHESMKFLKVEFPVDVWNTEASYETQHGINRRPTHYNTSWDMAKFEVVCHKWADLSEHGYGVSILNDSKYGFSTAGNMMRLSLLRAPKAPDAHCDMGEYHSSSLCTSPK